MTVQSKTSARVKRKAGLCFYTLTWVAGPSRRPRRAGRAGISPRRRSSATPSSRRSVRRAFPQCVSSPCPVCFDLCNGTLQLWPTQPRRRRLLVSLFVLFLSASSRSFHHPDTDLCVVCARQMKAPTLFPLIFCKI